MIIFNKNENKYMTPYEILKYPDKRLFLVSEEVESSLFGTIDLKKIIDNMFLTMKLNNGIGLAAPQVNIQKRIIVISINGKSIVLINPKIIEHSLNEKFIFEGCLSVNYIGAKVKRPDSIIVEYYDLNGFKNIIKAESILSACIQHEIDHLNGVLYINRINGLKKYFMTKKINKNINI